MKNVRMTICLVAVVLFMAAGQGFGIDFNDGGTYNIDYSAGYVYVDNGTPGMQTTVKLLNGGTIHKFWAYQDSRINISGGSVNLFLAVADNSQVIMSGGSVGLMLGAGGNSQVTMSGGTVANLQSEGNSHITMSGGIVVGNLYTNDSGHITIIGSNFAVDGSPVGFGQYFASDFVGGNGVITGTLNSGALLNNSFYISTDASFTLAPVPEPATLLLLGIGGLVLGRKKH